MDAKTLIEALDSLTIKDYLARGRPLAGLDDDALAARWAQDWRTWARDRCPKNSDAEDNARAEMMIRGLRLPVEATEPEYSLVQEEIARIDRASIDPHAIDKLMERVSAELLNKH